MREMHGPQTPSTGRASPTVSDRTFLALTLARVFGIWDCQRRTNGGTGVFPGRTYIEVLLLLLLGLSGERQ